MSPLPTISLPIAPGERFALLELPRQINPSEWDYLKHLLDVMAPGFVVDPTTDDETSPIEEYAAALTLEDA